MSLENAKAFYQKVKGDQDLQQKIGQFAKEDPKGIEAIIIKTAKENGFEFTEKEMKTFIAEETAKVNSNGELNDSELEAVAGGNTKDRILKSITDPIFCLHTISDGGRNCDW